MLKKVYQSWLHPFLPRNRSCCLASSSSSSSLSPTTSSPTPPTHTSLPRLRERQLLPRPPAGPLAPNARVPLQSPLFLRALLRRCRGHSPSSSVRGDETEGESRRETGLAESCEEGVSRDGHGHQSAQPDELVATSEDESHGVLIITAVGDNCTPLLVPNFLRVKFFLWTSRYWSFTEKLFLPTDCSLRKKLHHTIRLPIIPLVVTTSLLELPLAYHWFTSRLPLAYHYRPSHTNQESRRRARDASTPDHDDFNIISFTSPPGIGGME